MLSRVTYHRQAENQAHVYSVDSADGTYAGAIFNDEVAIAIHRYVLWRTWDESKLPLVVIGLNPSTATHVDLDPTVRRDIGYAKLWGYGGLVKLNIFSYRATDPQDMYDAAGAGIRIDGGSVNDGFLEHYCDPKRAGMVLCAWGNHGTFRDRGNIVASLLLCNGYRLYAMGFTKSKQPKHTLYLSKSLTPHPYTLPGEGETFEGVNGLIESMAVSDQAWDIGKSEWIG